MLKKEFFFFDTLKIYDFYGFLRIKVSNYRYILGKNYKEKNKTNMYYG